MISKRILMLKVSLQMSAILFVWQKLDSHLMWTQANKKEQATKKCRHLTILEPLVWN